MPNKTDSLDIYAQALGYPTEREMLKDLYENLGLSTTAIARILEVRSQSNVRIRLMRAGVKLRKRGGYMGRKAKTEEQIREQNCITGGQT